MMYLDLIFYCEISNPDIYIFILNTLTRTIEASRVLRNILSAFNISVYQKCLKIFTGHATLLWPTIGKKTCKTVITDFSWMFYQVSRKHFLEPSQLTTYPSVRRMARDETFRFFLYFFNIFAIIFSIAPFFIEATSFNRIYFNRTRYMI